MSYSVCTIRNSQRKNKKGEKKLSIKAPFSPEDIQWNDSLQHQVRRQHILISSLLPALSSEYDFFLR